MSRRQHLVAREKNGRPQRGANSELMPPAEVRRLVEMAGAGLRDPLWGSILGRIHLSGKISRAEFSAGKRWVELSAEYSVACQSPHSPRTTALDKTGGSPLDPDSGAGIKEARRHARASAAFVDGRYALRLAGPAAERAVDQICVHNYVPTGFDELQALQAGLRALSAWWSSRRKSPRADVGSCYHSALQRLASVADQTRKLSSAAKPVPMPALPAPAYGRR